MALKEIKLTNLVDLLDEEGSEYADFFRPMLGYEAILKLYEGINDDVEPMIGEIEDETEFEFPPDLISFYMNTNGGDFGDLSLYPLFDPATENTIHKLNVLDKELKTSIGLDNSSLLIGQYNINDNYIIVKIEDGEYVYKLWDAKTKTVKMKFEFILQLVALEVSYVTDYDGFMESLQNEEE